MFLPLDAINVGNFSPTTFAVIITALFAIFDRTSKRKMTWESMKFVSGIGQLHLPEPVIG